MPKSPNPVGTPGVGGPIFDPGLGQQTDNNGSTSDHAGPPGGGKPEKLLHGKAGK